MIKHWMDARERGIWDHPAADPPQPRHRNDNDVGTRLARVEEHLQFGAFNSRRVEEESRLRAKDLGEGLEVVSARMDDIEEKVQSLEQDRLTQQSILALASTFWTSARDLIKYALAIILTAMVVTGGASVDKVKSILSLWGSGSPGG